MAGGIICFAISGRPSFLTNGKTAALTGESAAGILGFSNPLLMGMINSDLVRFDVDLITDFLHKMSVILLPVLIIACIINHQFLDQIIVSKT